MLRFLVIAAIGLMVVSWLLPWWSADILALGKDILVIHPYGLEHHLGGIVDILPEGATDMPAFFAPLIWIYFGICIAILLYTLLMKYKEVQIYRFRFKLNKLLIGVVGFSYIIVAVLAIIIATIRTSELNMPLLGYNVVSLGWVYETAVDSSLQFGYYLAYGVGLILLVIALLYNKILGKSIQ